MMCIAIAIANVCPNAQAHFGRYVLPNPRKIKRITLIYWMVRDMAKPALHVLARGYQPDDRNIFIITRSNK